MRSSSFNGQKKESDSSELELQEVVNTVLVLRTEPLVFSKNSKRF